jgi:hypothetical protein
MITFKTESGSRYEVLKAQGTLYVRKVSGPDTTQRATPDWRECLNSDLPVVGQRWFINWGTLNPNGSTQATVTSVVTEVGRQDA